MNIFADLHLMIPRWKVVKERFLTEEEKQNIKSAIVVKGQWGLVLEFFTTKGPRFIPLSSSVDTVIGYIPNIDSIKVLTLEDSGDTLIRIEF